MNCEIIKFNINNQEEIDYVAQKASLIFKKGGIVIHPTDTCYGIAADIRNREAIKKVYMFKGRNFDKPLFIIVSNYSEFEKYGMWHENIAQIIKDNQEKMHTFVVTRKPVLPNYINPGLKTVGIQIPKIKISQALLKENGAPLIGTSANISGQSNNYSILELTSQLENVNRWPDLILDGGELPRKNPSSVVAVDNEGEIEILRQQ